MHFWNRVYIYGRSVQELSISLGNGNSSVINLVICDSNRCVLVYVGLLVLCSKPNSHNVIYILYHLQVMAMLFGALSTGVIRNLSCKAKRSFFRDKF